MTKVNYDSKSTLNRLERILSLARLQPINIDQIATEMGCHRTSLTQYVYHLLQNGCLKIDHKIKKTTYFAYVKPYTQSTLALSKDVRALNPKLIKVEVYKDPLVDMLFGRTNQ